MSSKFKILKAGTPIIARWPCTINEPVDSPDGVGRHQAKIMTCEFEMLDEEMISAEIQANGITGLLKRVTKGWDTTDEDGPVAFERFAEFVLVPYIRTGVYSGYIDFVSGMPEKN